MAKYLFRIDDMCPEMEWNKMFQIESLFTKYNVKPIIGVIPDNQDSKIKKMLPLSHFWKKINEYQSMGWIIAQHGFQHLYCTKNAGILKFPKKSEFAGLTIEEQRTKIELGKKILLDNNITSNIFMAPSHSFDKNTVIALVENGYKYITDGIGLYPYFIGDILAIPVQQHKFRKVFIGYITICIHPNSMTQIDIREMEKFIINNRKDIVSLEKVIIKYRFKYYHSILNYIFKWIYLLYQKIKGVY